mgnify:CR=1 FL=1
MTVLYKGFSTYNRSKKFTVTDLDLIKQDIFNHLNIKKGEKLMQPSFGTTIWDSLFDPLDGNLEETIRNEVKLICASDPRVTLRSLDITRYDYGIQMILTLQENATNVVDSMKVTFDQNAQTLTVAA